MSTKIALTIAGGAVGLFFGQPGLGATAGGILGQLISPNKKPKLPLASNDSLPLPDISIQTASYGQIIPLHFGRNRLGGQIIWAKPITAKGSIYYASFAVAFCQGEISGFGKIWCDSVLFYDDTPAALPMGVYASKIRARSIRFYLGSETQLPDFLIEADIGQGKTPAYRNLAYIVFEELNLSQLGNRIPQISTEVLTHQKKPAGDNINKSLVRSFYNVASGNVATAASCVFTSISQSSLRLLIIKTNKVNIYKPNGVKLLTTLASDIDTYYTNMNYACGRLNGCLLAVDMYLKKSNRS